MRAFIPNLITLLNLLSGVVGVLFCLGAFPGFPASPHLAAICILTGAFLDFFDGASARLLGVSSPIGAQLDSLADLVTFGLCPSMILYVMFNNSVESMEGFLYYFQVIIILSLPLFTAFRLAKFNVDEEQSSVFKGLPSPASALFILALALISEYQPGSFITVALEESLIFPAVALIMGLVMVANFPLHSLKFKSLIWKGNEPRWILISSSIILLACFGFTGVPFIILLYLIISLVNKPTTT